MYKAKKVTPVIYGFVKANLDNGVSYAKTIRLLFKNFKVRLGNTTLMLINRSWDYEDYCHHNGNKSSRSLVEREIESQESNKNYISLLLIALVVVIGLILYTIF